VSCDQILSDRSLVAGAHVVDLRVDLMATPRAAGQARNLVATMLDHADGGIHDGDTIYTAQLVTSELITNAVLHARTDLHLGLCHDGHTLLIAVADGAPAGQETTSAGSWRLCAEADESGRGMAIVATLAADFGWRPRTDMPGKVMWVLLRVPEAVG
jgi:anti-sigma regulatory factor (Ser/Thr protein kinase)